MDRLRSPRVSGRRWLRSVAHFSSCPLRVGLTARRDEDLVPARVVLRGIPLRRYGIRHVTGRDGRKFAHQPRDFAASDCQGNASEVRCRERASAAPTWQIRLPAHAVLRGIFPHLMVRDQLRAHRRRVMNAPIKFKIRADWDSLGNVLAARWGTVPPPSPPWQILAVASRIVRERVLRWPH